MALNTPTTQQLADNIISSIQASMNISVPLLPKSFTRVLAKSIAAVLVLLYKYSGFVFLQHFVRFASDKDTTINGVTINPLTEWGVLLGVGPPAGGTAAQLDLDILVINQVGSLPAGTPLISPDTGVTYLLNAAVILNATVVQGTVTAVSSPDGDGEGTIGNLPNASALNFANPLADVQTGAIVLGITIAGADPETSAAYRQRVQDRFQKPPQGGAGADYEAWAEEVPGIINVYPYADPTCPSTVQVYVEATPLSSGSTDGIPTFGQLQTVLDSIEADVSGLASRRPVNALVNTQPITRSDFPVEVFSLVAPDVAQTQVDITAAIEGYFFSRAPFIFGLTIPPRTDRVSRSSVSAVVEAIVSEAGGTFSSVVLRHPTSSSPIQLYVLGMGEKAKTTSVTYL